MSATGTLPIRSPKPGLFAGLRASLSGLTLTLRRGPVRRLYAKLVAIVTLVAVAFQAAGIWAVLSLWGPSAEHGWFANFGLILADIVGIILVLLAAPLLAILLVSIILPVLAERVFLAALETKRPDLAEGLRKGEGLSVAHAVQSTIRRALRLALGTAIAFAASLVPIAGVILGPAIQIWVTSRALTWELLDPWFDLQKIPYPAQREFIAAHNRMAVGFGAPYVLLMAIPVIGPMTFGIAQSGAGLLVADALTPQAKG